MEQLAPPALALSWDNPGLICGRRDREVRKVLVALDAAEPVVERALEEGCDLILTHHPMIFKPVPKINSDTALGRKLIKLLGRDICCYAMHTNFDIAPGCMADLVCEKMGAEKAGPLEPSLGFDGLPLSYGVGFIGTLPEPLAVPELARRLRQQFDLKGLVYYDANKGEFEVYYNTEHNGNPTAQRDDCISHATNAELGWNLNDLPMPDTSIPETSEQA